MDNEDNPSLANRGAGLVWGSISSNGIVKCRLPRRFNVGRRDALVGWWGDGDDGR